MLADTALNAAVAVGSYAVVSKTTNGNQENSNADSADVTDSQSINNPTEFGPSAVSISSSNLLTALVFQEKYGAPSTNERVGTEDEVVSADIDLEEGADAKEPDDVEARAEADAAKERDPTQLSADELVQVQALTLQDARVRNNEEAHVRVGGQYTSQPEYQFETGPDSRQYAISGRVEIDARSISGNPEETIRKLRIVQRAALAPAEPSTEDRRVAAIASNGIQHAIGDIRQRIIVENRQQQAETSRAADDAALEQSRLEALQLKELQAQELQQRISPEISPDDFSRDGSSVTSPSESNPAQAKIAALALERTANLTAPTSVDLNAEFSNSSAANATVISNNDVSLATITAAPGLFVNAAA